MTSSRRFCRQHSMGGQWCTKRIWRRRWPPRKRCDPSRRRKRTQSLNLNRRAKERKQMAKSKTKAADKEPEKEQAPSHSPRIGDRVPVILRNGKERFLDVVAVITDDTPLDNVTVKGTLHSLGLEDGES